MNYSPAFRRPSKSGAGAGRTYTDKNGEIGYRQEVIGYGLLIEEEMEMKLHVFKELARTHKGLR
jgi:hypothetical protein